MYRNLKLVYSSKATSQNLTKLFYTGVEALCQRTVLSQLTTLSLSTHARFCSYFDGESFRAGFWYKISLRWRFVTWGTGAWTDNSATTSHFQSVSTSKGDEVTCCCTFLSGGCWGCWHSISELYSKLPMGALIFASFSPFFPLKVILWLKNYKDSSSNVKDDSLSELYSPNQSMPLYSRFSRSICSLSGSSFFLLLLAHFYLGKVLNILCSKLFGLMSCSQNVLIASLSGVDKTWNPLLHPFLDPLLYPLLEPSSTFKVKKKIEVIHSTCATLPPLLSQFSFLLFSVQLERRCSPPIHV